MKRFWNKVNKTSTCWIWFGAKDSSGYGTIGMSNPRRTLSTHRVSYEMHHGKIKKGKRCLHTCDNPACVNPKHLWLGTQIDNVRDMTKKGRRVDHLGSKHGMAKLNESDVLKIRETHANNIVSYKSIARNYGVTPETISNVVRRKNWTHI